MFLFFFFFSFLCGNICAKIVFERGPQKLLKTHYSLAIPLPVEQLFCGQVQRQLALPIVLLSMLDVPMWSTEGKGSLCRP